MTFSDKLNGYWEEGYHYYLEIRDADMTVRDYRRSIVLETEISYDGEALERGENTVIALKDNVLSRTFEGEMMSEIKELVYEDGELKMLYNYTIMGETLYTLKKTDQGPFDHIRIRDGEYLDRLQGDWIRWQENGKGDVLRIKGNTISWQMTERRFHAVSYSYAPDEVRLVPEDLISSDFGGFSEVKVLPDMLTAWEIIFDMSVPLSVFARKEMLDKITVPEEAKKPYRNTMTAPMRPLMKEITPSDTKDPEVFCQVCGHAFKGEKPKFCPLCGSRTIWQNRS